MPNASPKNQDFKIAEAALRLAARGWDKVTVRDIAKAVKIPIAVFQKRFAGTNDVLPLIAVYVSAKAFAGLEKPEATAPVQERLFDSLMARFDVLQRHRKAFLALSESAQRQPKIAVIMLRAQAQAMRATLKFSGADPSKPCGALSASMLLLVYLAAFKVWRQDETLDMSKTMAALDRYLRYAARAATLFRIGAA